MITYIDCGAGVAGDMLLSALIGLGLSPRDLERVLRLAIPVKGWRLQLKHVERQMWPAWSLRVIGDRPFKEPNKMIEVVSRSRLPSKVRQSAARILTSLKDAERAAHGHDHAHFDPRGLGRIDTLVDVIGCAWGFWRLGLRDVTASAVNTGRIAPATAHLLARAKIPVFSDAAKLELATPTGVAILSQLANRFESMPPLLVSKTGYGAGTRERDGKPNVLAIYQGTPARKLLKYRFPNYATSS